MPDTTINTHHEKDFIHTIGAALSSNAPPHRAYKMTPQDRANYLAMLNGEQPSPIPDEQAHRILDALWSIMVAFVDLGFPPAPARTCGQVAAKFGDKCDKRTADLLDSPHPETDINHKASEASGVACEG